jgi:hypothetical protein
MKMNRVTFAAGTESMVEKKKRMARRSTVESMYPDTARPLFLGEAFMAVMDIFVSKRNEVGFFDYLDAFAIGQTNKTIRSALLGDMTRRKTRLENGVTDHFHKAVVALCHMGGPDWRDLQLNFSASLSEIEEMHKHILSLHQLKGTTKKLCAQEFFVRGLLSGAAVPIDEIHSTVMYDYDDTLGDDPWWWTAELLEDNKEHLIVPYKFAIHRMMQQRFSDVDLTHDE